MIKKNPNPEVYTTIKCTTIRKTLSTTWKCIICTWYHHHPCENTFKVYNFIHSQWIGWMCNFCVKYTSTPCKNSHSRPTNLSKECRYYHISVHLTWTKSLFLTVHIIQPLRTDGQYNWHVLNVWVNARGNALDRRCLGVYTTAHSADEY